MYEYDDALYECANEQGLAPLVLRLVMAGDVPFSVDNTGGSTMNVKVALRDGTHLGITRGDDMDGGPEYWTIIRYGGDDDYDYEDLSEKTLTTNEAYAVIRREYKEASRVRRLQPMVDVLKSAGIDYQVEDLKDVALIIIADLARAEIFMAIMREDDTRGENRWQLTTYDNGDLMDGNVLCKYVTTETALTVAKSYLP